MSNNISTECSRKCLFLNRSSSYKNTILSARPLSHCVAVLSPSLFPLGYRHRKLCTKQTTIKWWEDTSKEKEGIKSICILRLSLQLTPIIFLFAITFPKSTPLHSHTLTKIHTHFNTLSHVRKNYSFFFFFFKKTILVSQYFIFLLLYCICMKWIGDILILLFIIHSPQIFEGLNFLLLVKQAIQTFYVKKVRYKIICHLLK